MELESLKYGMQEVTCLVRRRVIVSHDVRRRVIVSRDVRRRVIV